MSIHTNILCLRELLFIHFRYILWFFGLKKNIDTSPKAILGFLFYSFNFNTILIPELYIVVRRSRILGYTLRKHYQYQNLFIIYSKFSRYPRNTSQKGKKGTLKPIYSIQKQNYYQGKFVFTQQLRNALFFLTFKFVKFIQNDIKIFYISLLYI